MSQKIIVPTLGESVTEATVSKWLKSQGEKVVSDEPIVELETDKVNIEVPAPSNGTLEMVNFGDKYVKYVGRKAASSTATGNLNKHLAQQKEILEKILKD